jgi:hypothetical protein
VRYPGGIETRDEPGQALLGDPSPSRQAARLDRLRVFLQERKDSGALSAAKQEKCLAVLVKYVVGDASEDVGL